MPKYRFSEIAFNSTAKKKPTEADKDTYIGLEHLDAGNLAVTRWGADVAPVGEKLIMKRGDVLFGKRRAYQKKVAIAPFDGIFSAHGMVLRPNESVVTKEYFPLFLSSDYFLDEAIRISVGSLSPTINWKDLKELTFNIPNIDEQKRITPLVWAAIEAKNAYKALLERTDDLVKSQFIGMFGDPVLNEKQWPVAQLNAIAEIRIGPFGSLLHKEDYIEGGHALINPSHIVDGYIVPDEKLTVSDEKYEELSAYKLKKGDVVLGRRGEMGRCAVVNEDGFLCGTGSMIIRPSGKMQSYFLQKMLSSPSYRAVIEGKAVGVTMMNLNVPIVSSLMIPLLPSALQDEYIAFVRQSDKSKFELKQSIERIDNLIKSLIQQG